MRLYLNQIILINLRSMLYKVQNNESIYDVTVKLYGNVKYVIKLCVDNSINLNSDIENLVLEYDASIKNSVPDEFRLNYIPPTPDNNYMIMQNQSIYDLSLMFGYGIENCLTFFLQQNYNCDTIAIGGNILVSKNKTRLSDYVTLNSIKFATNIDDSTSYYRLLEDGYYRLLEDGSRRLLE